MDFGFPYTPYEIQNDFMKNLYETIEQKKVGVFESPTGTGKSLSIICATGKWLHDEKNKSKTYDIIDSNEPLWVQEQFLKRKRREEQEDAKKKQDQQESRKKRVKKQKFNRVKLMNMVQNDPEDDDVLVNYDEESTSGVGINGGLLNGLFDSTDEEKDSGDEDSPLDPFQVPKIIYASRTHTQLDQFIGELRKTKYIEDLNVVALASRTKLCIHPKISKIGSRINDACLDLKKHKDKTKRCMFAKQGAEETFKDNVLTKTRDIEDLVRLGKEITACPYFGTRRSVPYADLIVLPYNSLIHKQTRESLGIKLEDCVVIIDEAHNLVDAVVNIHSMEISSLEVTRCQSLLSTYFEKYRNRLKPKNQNRVKQLLGILNSIAKFLKQDSNENTSKILSVTDFIFSCKMDQINLFEVEEFIVRSELAKKLNGFIEKRTEIDAQRESNSIYAVTSFLISLTNIDKDGKLIFERNIVKSARSVILCGGTMEPVSIMIQQLFPSVPKDKLTFFSCGHVIPRENLICHCISSGPARIEFDFTFSGRSNLKMIEDLGRYILFMSKIVPDGIIIFYPSYQYEEHVYDHLVKIGMISKIEKAKKYLRESRKSSYITQVFSDFKTLVDTSTSKSTHHGSILACIVGGKMSEGINFSDGYARSVIVVGLPYPNPNDVELSEKMAFLDKSAKGAGQEYYESICMRAVNQSIGRSIRHIADYSTICLLDKRFQNMKIRNNLPKWIQSRITKHDQFHTSLEGIKEFFTSHEKSQQEIENKRFKDHVL